MKRLFAGLLSLIIMIPSALSVTSAEEVSVSAKSAVLMLADTGEIIWSKDCDTTLPMASTTKIMTAVVVLESIDDLSKTVEVSPDACGVEGSSVYLKPNEKLTAEQLLFALLLESANDAATALAIEVAGDVPSFAEMMNETAERIGLENSHFTNPHGLDDDAHYTTAADLARLTAYAMKNADFNRIVSTYKTTIPMNGDEGTRLLLNHNKMLKYYDGAIGVKTGFTKRCGRCLVSAAERGGVTLIAVTLSAPDDWNDHKAMLDYGFSSFKSADLAVPGSVRYTLPVVNSADGTTSVTLSNREGLSVTLPVDADDPYVAIEAPRFTFAPVEEGDVMGYAVFMSGNSEVGRLPLYAESGCAAPKKRSLWEKFLDLYK